MTVDASAGSEDLARAWTAKTPVGAGHPVEDVGAMSLVVAARDGSRSAWDELVRRFTPLLWTIACGHRLSGHDATHVVEMTWLRVVERLREAADQGSVAVWLVTLCHRESLIAVRQDVAADRQGGGCRATDTDAGITPHDGAVLHEAISTLPDRPRQMLLGLLNGDDSGHG